MENLKEAYKLVFEDLRKCDMFIGKYDARNGNPNFMYGICTVMENIAYTISEEVGKKYSDLFSENMQTSKEAAYGKRQSVKRNNH